MTPGAERTRQWRQRKIDAGYRIVHGNPTLAPRVHRQKGTAPHGTTTRYTAGCRCDACRIAAVTANRERRQRQRATRR